MKLGKLVLSTILAVSSATALAGNFVNLTTGVGGTLNVANGGLVSGVNNSNADKLFITTTSSTLLTGFNDARAVTAGGTGDVVPTSITYRAFTGSTTINTGTLTLLDWRKTDNLEISPIFGPQITVYDFVFRDSFDNKLVFGSRYLNRVANNQEINFHYRYGFNGFSAATAWTFVTNSDLRMYEAGRTNDNSFSTSVAYDVDAIRMKGDFSLTEDNPWSGLNLVKTNAFHYAISDNALGYFQAGEEGQAKVGKKIAGFVPTDGDVPLPTWVLLLMTATLFAIKFKSEKRLHY